MADEALRLFHWLYICVEEILLMEKVYNWCQMPECECDLLSLIANHEKLIP